ncbi:hypothetical protein MKQ70_07830 [Chitinophaga sedimenti]|nr:hypothetical protein [Chitinophaga sedimenti]MCK7554918.1 hypothetical protein [Chitinophaga sedimenti]
MYVTSFFPEMEEYIMNEFLAGLLVGKNPEGTTIQFRPVTPVNTDEGWLIIPFYHFQKFLIRKIR